MDEHQASLDRIKVQLAALSDELWRLGERVKAAWLVLEWVDRPIRPSPAWSSGGPGYYDQITALSDDLWRAGEREWASKLVMDVASGATGGEIAMALRMHLWTLRRSYEAERLGLEQRIDNLLAPLDAWHKSITTPH
jgi:hypothetical protein